jgi:hypothetical protein
MTGAVHLKYVQRLALVFSHRLADPKASAWKAAAMLHETSKYHNGAGKPTQLLILYLGVYAHHCGEYSNGKREGGMKIFYFFCRP